MAAPNTCGFSWLHQPVARLAPPTTREVRAEDVESPLTRLSRRPSRPCLLSWSDGPMKTVGATRIVFEAMRGTSSDHCLLCV